MTDFCLVALKLLGVNAGIPSDWLGPLASARTVQVLRNTPPFSRDYQARAQGSSSFWEWQQYEWARRLHPTL